MTSPDPTSALRHYIEEQCGIELKAGKAYLIESRLAALVAETGCKSFEDLYQQTRNDESGDLCDRIIDAMTTNETLWFRDDAMWTALREHVIPNLFDRIRSGQSETLHIWCAACSTGQEPYSLAILMDELLTRSGETVDPAKVSILATDISESALAIARSARYDRIAMSRGMPDALRDKYFTTTGAISELDPAVRARVRFQKWNLQHDFSRFGWFDLVLMRNVAIYFADHIKHDIFDRMAESIWPGGYFFLGSSESLLGYESIFQRCEHGSSIFYQIPMSHIQHAKEVSTPCKPC